MEILAELGRSYFEFFSGDFIVLSPALIVEEDHISTIVETLRKGVQSI